MQNDEVEGTTTKHSSSASITGEPSTHFVLAQAESGRGMSRWAKMAYMASLIKLGWHPFIGLQRTFGTAHTIY